jgi:hypothetical protein
MSGGSNRAIIEIGEGLVQIQKAIEKADQILRSVVQNDARISPRTAIARSDRSSQGLP